MTDATAVTTSKTEDLAAPVRAAIVALCVAAFDEPDFLNLFTYVPSGGMHFLAYRGGELVSHAMVTTPAEEAAATPDATTDALPIESVDAAQCDALQAALSEQLDHELTKQEGAPCTLVATGTGEDFGSFVDVAQTIRDVFVAEGWTEDESAMADGPTGTATGFFKDTTVAQVSVGWEPAADANCPTDQPISACDIAPSQQNFTISIALVQIA